MVEITLRKSQSSKRVEAKRLVKEGVRSTNIACPDLSSYFSLLASLVMKDNWSDTLKPEL